MLKARLTLLAKSTRFKS